MTFTVNKATVLDESAGLQSGGSGTLATTLPGGGIEDNIGNDVDLAQVTEPQIVADAVTAYGAPLAVAQSGSGTITVGANTTALGFTGAGGAALPVYAGGAGTGGAVSGLTTTGGEAIYLFRDASNDNIVVGRDASGDVAFVIILAETSSGGVITGAEFWMLQYQAIDNGAGGTGTAHDNLVDLTNKLFVSSTATTELLFDQFDGVSGQNQWLGFAPTKGDLTYSILLTGLEPTGSGDFDGDGVLEAHTVNTSNAQSEDAIGSNSQSVVVGDGVRFEIVSNLDRTADTKNIDTTNYLAHLDLTDAGFTLVQTGGPASNKIDVQVTVYDTGDEDGAQFNDGIADDAGDLATIASVKVFRGGSDGSTLPTGVSVTITGGVAQINDLLEGDRVVFYAASGTTFNRVVVLNNTNEGAANDTFDIGRFTATSTSSSTASTEVGSFLDFADDGPTLTLARNTVAATHDETPGVQADTDIAAASLPAAILTLFNGVTNKSTDLVAGYAQSASSVVTVSADAGRDGAGTTSYALDVGNVNSGLQTTEGAAINLVEEGSLVVGRIASGAFAGQAAFAIAIDENTGQLSIAQFHSLKHPTGGTSYDESVNIAAGALLAVVTVTDSEDDSATASVGIGTAVVFQDDGPFIGDPPDRTVSFAANATTPAATFALTGVDGVTIDVVGIPEAFVTLGGDTITSSVFTDGNGHEGVRGVDSSGGDTFYELTFDPAAGTDLGSYTLKVFQAPPLVLNLLDFSAVKAGGPQESLTVENITFSAGFIQATGGIFATFADAVAPLQPQSDDINPNNAGGIGIGDGNIQELEALVIDVTASSNQIAGVRFEIQGVGGGIGAGDVLWEAVDNGTVVASGFVTVDLRSQTGAHLVDIQPGKVFDQLYVALDPADFDSNDSARINKIYTLEVAQHPDIVLGFRVNADDGDGDQQPATYEEFTVTIDGTGAGSINPGILGV